MRTKNPALIRSQERRDIELKKILILPIDQKNSQSTEIDQTKANRGRKKGNTIYREIRREEEKRRQKQARKENNTERD